MHASGHDGLAGDPQTSAGTDQGLTANDWRKGV
jgi:hypothetical protein